MKHSVRSGFVQKAGTAQPSGDILRFLPFDPAESIPALLSRELLCSDVRTPICHSLFS